MNNHNCQFHAFSGNQWLQFVKWIPYIPPFKVVNQPNLVMIYISLYVQDLYMYMISSQASPPRCRGLLSVKEYMAMASEISMYQVLSITSTFNITKFHIISIQNDGQNHSVRIFSCNFCFYFFFLIMGLSKTFYWSIIKPIGTH